MNLEQRINQDLKEAMIAKDATKVDALRAVKSAFAGAKTEKNAKEFTDVVGNAILQKMVAQRLESSLIFRTAGRDDLADKEGNEVIVLRSYLPAEMDEKELDQLITETVAQSSNLGEVMKTLKSTIEAGGYPYNGRAVAEKVKVAMANQ